MTRSHFIGLLAFLLACAPLQADDLKTLSGKGVSGTLQKISDTEIILQPGGSVPLPQVLDLVLRPGKTLPDVPRYLEVRLTDDSLLRCTKVTFGPKEGKLELTSGATITVPLTAFHTVLRDAQEQNLRNQWDKFLRDKKNRDRIFILKDGDLNPINGILGAIDEGKQTVKFTPEVGGKELEPQFEKIHGLQFTRTDVPSEPSLCRIVDVHGNVLVASKLAYASGGPLQITTPFGHKVSLDVKAVSKFDFNFGRLTYLSDLDAKMPDPVFLGGFNPVRKDRNLDGDELILLDKKYDKGLSLYAGTELEYNLAGKYKDFKAVLGVDPRIAEEGQGKVTVAIYCDRVKQKEFAVSTKETIPIAVSVKDVTSLRIVVNGSNFTGLSGHAVLANAHVSQ